MVATLLKHWKSLSLQHHIAQSWIWGLWVFPPRLHPASARRRAAALLLFGSCDLVLRWCNTDSIPLRCTCQIPGGSVLIVLLQPDRRLGWQQSCSTISDSPRPDAHRTQRVWSDAHTPGACAHSSGPTLGTHSIHPTSTLSILTYFKRLISSF